MPIFSILNCCLCHLSYRIYKHGSHVVQEYGESSSLRNSRLLCYVLLYELKEVVRGKIASLILLPIVP